MRQITLILLTIAVAHASVTVTRTSNDGPHPSTMEIAVALPDSNNNILIPLTRTDAFEDIPITLLNNGVSRTFSSRQVHHPSHSHYRNVDSKSVISVRHVNGKRQISGHVMHEGTSYFLEPVGESEHRVVKNPRNPDVIDKLIDNRKLKVVSRRKRRANFSPTKYTVELRLLLDSSVWNAFKTMYGDEKTAMTEVYFAYGHILNGIDTAYRNIGSQLSISVECVGIAISQTARDDEWMNGANGADVAILKRMIIYSYFYDREQTADHTMAFTRTKFYQEGGTPSSGVALLNSVCTRKSVSVSHDWGLHTWTTAAHELAHSLGAGHDGDKNDCYNPINNLMAKGSLVYTQLDVSNTIRFSKCSIADMSSHIQSLGSQNCLIKINGRREDFWKSSQAQGTRLTLDQVCRISFPNFPSVKFSSTSPYGEKSQICAHIYCKYNGRYVDTDETLRAPAGTPCDTGKRCDWNGHCT